MIYDHFNNFLSTINIEGKNKLTFSEIDKRKFSKAYNKLSFKNELSSESISKELEFLLIGLSNAINKNNDEIRLLDKRYDDFYDNAIRISKESKNMLGDLLNIHGPNTTIIMMLLSFILNFFEIIVIEYLSIKFQIVYRFIRWKAKKQVNFMLNMAYRCIFLLSLKLFLRYNDEKYTKETFVELTKSILINYSKRKGYKLTDESIKNISQTVDESFNHLEEDSNEFGLKLKYIIILIKYHIVDIFDGFESEDTNLLYELDLTKYLICLNNLTKRDLRTERNIRKIANRFKFKI